MWPRLCLEPLDEPLLSLEELELLELVGVWCLRPFGCRSALRPRWGSARLCWECLLGLDRHGARAVSPPVTWAWSLSELLGESDEERNRALCRVSVVESVGCGWSHCPHHWCSNALSAGRSDIGSAGSAACEWQPLGQCSSVSFAGRSAGSAACERQPLGRCSNVSSAGRV